MPVRAAAGRAGKLSVLMKKYREEEGRGDVNLLVGLAFFQDHPRMRIFHISVSHQQPWLVPSRLSGVVVEPEKFLGGHIPDLLPGAMELLSDAKVRER